MNIQVYCKPFFTMVPCGFLSPDIKPSLALPYPLVQTSFKGAADFLNYIICKQIYFSISADIVYFPFPICMGAHS